MVNKLDDQDVVIHKGHGIVTVGKSLEEACVTALLLEGSAKMQYFASRFGELEPFSCAEAINFAKERHFETDSTFWRYYENKWKKKTWDDS